MRIQSELKFIAMYLPTLTVVIYLVMCIVGFHEIKMAISVLSDEHVLL